MQPLRLWRGAPNQPGVSRNLPDLSGPTPWHELLDGIETAVFCAGLAHGRRTTDAELRIVNGSSAVDACRALSSLGGRRFLFVSSIAVFDDATLAGQGLSQPGVRRPSSVYGQAKLSAEDGLRVLRESGGIQSAAIRPAMVYGTHAPGSWRRLVHHIMKWHVVPAVWPPAQRSFTSISALADLLAKLAMSTSDLPSVINCTDAHPVTTTDFVRAVSDGLGIRALSVPIPASLVHIGARLVGRKDDARRLTDSFTIASSPDLSGLGWCPEQDTLAAAEMYAREERDEGPQ